MEVCPKESSEYSSSRGISIFADGPTTSQGNILTPILDNKGKMINLLYVSRDITLKALAKEQLKTISKTTSLMGLRNRRMFKKHLRLSLSKARLHTEQVSVLFIDLDNCRNINETLGYATGDRALIQFTARPKKKISPAQTFISRLGGDEFSW